MARGPVEANRTGWVYRSDRETPRVLEMEQVAADVRAHSELEPISRPITGAAQSHYVGIIERGLLLMTVPVAIGVAIMVAPMIWMFGTNERSA